MASRAFDNDEGTFTHCEGSPYPQWLKAVFTQRVLIYHVEFVNRPGYWSRCNYVDLKTVLYRGSQSFETKFGSIEIAGARESFTCMKYADALLVVKTEENVDMNIAEIKLFGRVIN